MLCRNPTLLRRTHAHGTATRAAFSARHCRRVACKSTGGDDDQSAVIEAMARQIEDAREAASKAARRAGSAEAEAKQLTEALEVADRARRAAVAEVTALLAKQREAALRETFGSNEDDFKATSRDNTKQDSKEVVKTEKPATPQTPIEQLPEDLPAREWKALLAAALDARDRAIEQRDEFKRVAFESTRRADITLEQLVVAKRQLAAAEGSGGVDTTKDAEAALKDGAARGEMGAVLDQLLAAEGGGGDDDDEEDADKEEKEKEEGNPVGGADNDDDDLVMRLG
ncbi:hypothetical protein PPROV_000433700 [Pycnococcus provasolii]|uniref:Uncharacterized protein n=3 Tax=Pycnococcus provasolii TaxID=41880 RepID=A0A830HKP2_9CHLO|nr:hypothetical protein PPROV_000433700 [Pycnococcus provasolii]